MRLAQPSTFPQGSDKAITLALSLAQAEKAIHEFTSGQVDAIVDAEGRAYLLRPAQERLRENEDRLQIILESTGDGITVINREGFIVSQNRGGTRMLGYERDELLGKNFFELLDPVESHRFYSAFFNVIEDFRADAIVEFSLQARDGLYLKVEAMLSKLRATGVARIVLTCRDTTQRSPAQEEADRREATLIEESLTKDRREAELVEQSLSKDRFIAMLSHELRTPLSPISLGVEELREDERFIEAWPTLTMIRRNVDLQSRLLEELFDFTKVGQHKVQMRLEAIDAHEAVGFVLEICKAEIAAAEITVLLDLAATEKRVLADSVRLQQVMWNLVKNAVKFSAPGSIIAITSANDVAGELTLQFIDHGVGIEPALLPLLFNPFRQGNHDKPHLSGGLGLGLFIAKGMIEAQEGTLSVASDGHGQGATFCVTLNTCAQNQPCVKAH
jgi:two-component system CheB/CheR fusion protein